MICIIALIVFAILAVFSARYRPLAAEAFDCVFRRITFRKCKSNLDKRLKSQITGKLMKRSKKAGRFVYKYFEVFSWIFLLLLLFSLVQVGISGYNYAVYGNCNGPDSDGFCIFDPLGTNQPEVSESGVCAVPSGNETTNPLQAPDFSLITDNPKVGSSQAKVTVIEFGCFACPNTAKQQPAVKKIIEHFGTDIQFIYLDFPLPAHDFATEAAIAAHCVFHEDRNLYWQYHFLIFNQQESISDENLKNWAVALGIDASSFDSCYEGQEASDYIAMQSELAIASGIFGTPTFFINGEPLVGVQPYKLLKAKINDALDQ